MKSEGAARLLVEAGTPRARKRSSNSLNLFMGKKSTVEKPGHHGLAKLR
jgi:hypothetical protein